MTDHYKPRRDWDRMGLISLGVLGVVLLALLAFYAFGRGTSDGDHAAQVELSRQMDQAQAASDAAQTERRAEELRTMQ